MNVRLLRTEWRRFWLRRVTRVGFGVMLLAAVALMTLAVWKPTAPVSASERAVAAQQAHDENAQMSAKDRADCVRQRDADRAQGQDVSHFGCGDATVDTYLRPQSTRAQQLDAVPDVAMQLGMLAVLVVAASFVGAEFSSGSLGNQLTFEPRRGPTYWAKLLAAAMGSMVASIMLNGALLGTVYAVAGVHHAAAGTPAGGVPHLVWALARGVLAMGILALAVSALTMLVRHTAAVVGIAVGYTVVSQIVTNTMPRFSEVDLLKNLQAFIEGRASYFANSCSMQPGGYSCNSVEHSVWMWHGLGVLGTATAIVALLALAVFRRRDVN